MVRRGKKWNKKYLNLNPANRKGKKFKKKNSNEKENKKRSQNNFEKTNKNANENKIKRTPPKRQLQCKSNSNIVSMAVVTIALFDSRALLFEMEWLCRILDHGKKWEIRGGNCLIRGKVYLANSCFIYGHAFIVDSFPITKAELKESIHHHHVNDLSIVEYKTPHVWLLEDTQKYKKRRKFRRKPGQVTWCKFNIVELQ